MQNIQPVKLKVIKEPYAGRVLPTENNLATEEGLYSSFQFYGSGDINSRTGRQDHHQQQLFDVLSSDAAELLKKPEKVDLLSQRPTAEQQKQKAKSNVLKSLLGNPTENKKAQICVTEAEGG